MRSANAEPRFKWNFAGGWTVPILLFLSAVVLRLPGLAGSSLWFDEGCTVLVARLRTADFWSLLRTYYYAPPLFYLINSPLLSFFPHQEWVIRLPGFLLSSLFPAILWHKEKSYAHRLAAILWVVSPLAIVYSQEGRSYSLLAVLYGLLLLTGRQSVSKSKTSASVTWVAGLLIAAALWTHNLGVFLWIGFLLAQVLFLYVETSTAKEFRSRIRQQLPIHLIAMGALLLWIPFLLSQVKVFHGTSALSPHFADLGPFRAVLASLRNMVPGDTQASPIPLPILEAPRVLFGLAALLPFLIFARRLVIREVLYWGTAALVPLLLVAAASVVSRPIYWPGRTEVMVLPAFLVLMAFGVSAAPSRLARNGLCFLLFLGSLLSLQEFYRSSRMPRKESDRRVAAWILENPKPDWVVLDADDRASVVAYVEGRVPSERTAFLSEPFADRGEALAVRYFRRRAASEPSRSDSLRSFQDWMRAIAESPGKRVGIIYPEDGNHKRSSAWDGFLLRLQGAGCVLERAPKAFPMDWHANGNHVGLLVDCQKMSGRAAKSP